MSKSEEYEPFGEEWAKEMGKVSKSMLIQMFRESQLRLKELEGKKQKQKLELEKIKKHVLDQSEKGNVVVWGIEHLESIPLTEIINQPAEGILYDINRNELVILTFLDDPKWINDYACAQIIRELKKQLDEKSK